MKTRLFLLAAMGCLVGGLMLLSSCNVAFDPVTGQPVIYADSETISAVTAQVLEEINNDLQRDGK